MQYERHRLCLQSRYDNYHHYIYERRRRNRNYCSGFCNSEEK